MRVFKIIYNVLSRDKDRVWRVESSYSEQFMCKSIEEAIEYGKGKAEKMSLHFEGVAELKG